MKKSCHDHRSATLLEDCINLSPAGTGTHFLYQSLKRVVKAGDNRVRHDHLRTVASAEKEIGPVKCFIMTLRDPLERAWWAHCSAATPAATHSPHSPQRGVDVWLCAGVATATRRLLGMQVASLASTPRPSTPYRTSLPWRAAVINGPLHS